MFEMFKMNSIWSWILISVCFGLVAGAITAIYSRHARKEGEAQQADSGDDYLDEVEGSRGANILFVVLVFSILAFLVVWLVSAVSGHTFS